MGRLCRLLCKIALVAVFFSASPAAAQPFPIAISQYKHTRWTIDDGLPGGVRALAQGKDGFLWIGTATGLARFDGRSFELIPPQVQIRDRDQVSAVLVARDGSVWAGYGSGGVARYSAGVLRDMGAPHPTEFVQRLRQTQDGAIWGLLGRTDLPLIRYSNGKWEEIGGASWGLPNLDGCDLLVAKDGTLWFSAYQGIFFLRPGARRFERSATFPVGLAALAQDALGNIWASDQKTARVITRPYSKALFYPVPFGPRSRNLLVDRNGALWGTSNDTGIYKIEAPNPLGEPSPSIATRKVERFGEAESLTAPGASAALEDRDGNIWIGTSGGLDRFRPVPVIREPSLAMVPLWSLRLLATAKGDVFFGQHDGVYRARPGERPARLISGFGETEALCQGRDGNIWIVTQHNIMRFTDKVVETIRRPTAKNIGMDCAVDNRGVLFIAVPGGVFERVATGWRFHPIEQDSDTGGMMPVIALRDGSILAYATSRSLRLFAPPRVTEITLSRPSAIRQLNVFYERSDSILLGGRFGMARWRGKRFDFITEKQLPLSKGTYGIIEAPDGNTWLMARGGIVKVATADLERAFGNPDWQPKASLFDTHDGLPAGGDSWGQKEAVRGGDGRLWFATRSGTVWIDPTRLRRNALPPPVAINGLRLDEKLYREPVSMVVPAHTNSVVIAFSAVSLGVPERVRVRYRMEGADKDWIEAGSLRQVSYNDLGPGSYRFRVIAANEDGVWNTKGAALSLTVEPTFFQSTAFKILCAAIFGILLWAAYSIRTRQLTARVRERLETRHGERERIARELHDTLLQGFQGLVLRFQSVANRMPASSELRPPLDLALEQAESVLTEGRNRVSELRMSEENSDLAGDIALATKELGVESQIPITVTVEGRVRPLEPVVRDELLRISEEAVRNAVRHANPGKIEIGLVYARQVRLGIRDDGSGLPEDVASAGKRQGHFGLVGMRERAERAGGRLDLSTSPGAGTEIRVTVPGRLAYLNPRRRKLFKIRRN